MPPIVNFSIETVKAVFSEHGIYVLREFPDGQLLWGTEPISEPYRGEFQMSQPYPPGRMDIFSIRGILSKLDKAGKSLIVEEELFKSLEEEEYEVYGSAE